MIFKKKERPWAHKAWILLAGFWYTVGMKIEFNGKIWYWRGPAPHYFVSVPVEQSGELRVIAGLVTYGWGMIPVIVRIGGTEWQTSLFPKDGGYIVPIRLNVRNAENLAEGDEVNLKLEVQL